MGKKRPDGICCICGVYGPLTFEHIPPEAAFNDRKILEADIKQIILAQTIEEWDSVRKISRQRGAGRHSLCERCNNDTGRWYVPDYIHWARQGWWNIYNNAGYIYHRPFEINPLNVAKQVIAMFASACGPSLFAEYTDLRYFVLNREINGLPPEIRIFAYYVSPDSIASRQSGITSNIDISVGGSPYVYAEIAFPPFGYIMTLNSRPPSDKLTDITFMACESSNRQRTISLHLIGLEVNSFIPADFRSEAQIAKAYDMSRR